MTDDTICVEQVIHGHYYALHFNVDGYGLVCEEISRWKRDGCPLSWFDAARLRNAVKTAIKDHKRRQRCLKNRRSES